MKFIGKILPVEGYYVRFYENPPIDYAKSLTHLYQPLVGMKAIMLYQTLLHEIDLQNESSLQTHHTLMNYLKIPLDEIYEARIQLEGIGLLKTFENKVDDRKFYIYELLSPFTPNHFFNDAMLSELLYHHIGKAKYDLLKNHYHEEQASNSGHEVTQSFSDVFQTFQPLFEEIEPKEDNSNEKNSPRINPIDFSWMETMLKQRMIPVKKILTMDNQKIITEMMFLYDLATYEVEKSLLWALTEENILDIEEFKQACHDVFKTKRNVTPIKLVRKTQEKQIQDTIKRPLTKEEQLIQRLETISPKHLLEDLSSGGQASEQDMRIIREVMTNQGLPAPVMNVLIHFVLLQSNMKLSKAYLEKIASHWSRAGLQSAKQAMVFAKKEIASFQKGGQGQRGNNRQVSNEVIPDWFKEKDSKEPRNSQAKKDSHSEKERAELDALMRQYAEDS